MEVPNMHRTRTNKVVAACARAQSHELRVAVCNLRKHGADTKKHAPERNEKKDVSVARGKSQVDGMAHIAYIVQERETSKP